MKKLVLVSVIGLVFSCKDSKSQESYTSDSVSDAHGQSDSLSASSSMNSTATPDSSNLNSSTTTPRDSLTTTRDSARNR